MSIKEVLIIVVIVIVIVAFCWGAFSIAKWINYTLFYKSKVEARVQPIEKRLTDLESRVKVLEKR